MNDEKTLRRSPLSLQVDLSKFSSADFEPASEEEKSQQEVMSESVTFFLDGMRRLRKNPLEMASVVVLVLILLTIIIAPMIVPYGYDEIIVMYGGRVCERGTADDIFYEPAHEYTKGLLRSIPTAGNTHERLQPIGGTPINLLNMPEGCAFCTRCDNAMKICLTQVPEELQVGEHHRASCWMNVKQAMEEAAK